jgi:hypothetical protein
VSELWPLLQPPAMKFLLHISILAAVLVASTHAIKCNIGYFVGGQNACTSKDIPGVDTCTNCVSQVPLGGSTITPVIYGQACGPNPPSEYVTCPMYKAQCEGTTLKGKYSKCKTDNCNTCSLASARQVSAFLLVVALACALF